MIGLLAPLWLAALATLAVPLALHLRSRRPARTVRLGSLRHLAGAAPEARSMRRVADPWVLLLRLATLAALVLALAGTYRRTAAAGADVALVAPEALHDAPAATRAVLDSLRAAGVAPQLLAPGFPALERRDGAGPRAPTPLWSLLREADAALPAGARLVVVAPLRLDLLGGPRPRLARPVVWRAIPSARDTAALARDTAAGASAVRRVVIHAAASRRDDARYLAAAFRAVALASGAQAAVDIASSDAPDTLRAGDWLVALGAPPSAAALAAVRAGAVLLTDGETGGDTAPAPADGWLVTEAAAVPARLAAGASADSGSAAVLWRDGRGAPLLTAAAEGAGVRYRFAGRFDPASTDLVLRPEFPAVIAALWRDGALLTRATDARPVALAQALPGGAAPSTRAGAGAGATASLAGPLWLAAALLFLADRLLAAWRAREAR